MHHLCYTYHHLELLKILHSGHIFIYLRVFFMIARENGAPTHPVYNINGMAFIIEMESVYCAVRIDALTFNLLAPTTVGARINP